MATGVLPILIGNATKAQSLLPESDKEYEATFSFGITTDTLDITGKVLSQTESNVKSEDLETVLPQFRGDIMQLPPMYSAVSKDGVRLYELARKGLVTEREARPITVYKLDLLNFDEQLQSASFSANISISSFVLNFEKLILIAESILSGDKPIAVSTWLFLPLAQAEPLETYIPLSAR